MTPPHTEDTQIAMSSIISELEAFRSGMCIYIRAFTDQLRLQLVRCAMKRRGVPKKTSCR